MLALWNRIRWSCSLQKRLSAWQDSHPAPSSTFSRPWAGLGLLLTPQVLPCSEHQSRLCQSSRFVMVQGVSQILMWILSKLLCSHSTTAAGWPQRARNEGWCEGWREIPQTLLDMFNRNSLKAGCDPHKTNQGKHSVFFVACAAWVKVMFSFSCAFDARI